MFFSPEDDDDFSPSFGGGSKSNLSSLFGGGQAGKSGNESLTYTAPKQPKKQAAPATSQDTPAVLHAVAAQAYKFVNGQYASQGKLGAAVLGSHSKKEYRVLLYVSKKQQVTTAKITSGFSFVVQPNNYASFYDDARQSWSLRFDSLQNLVDFAKQIGLARYNAAPGSLTKQDLLPGDGQEIEIGDVIEVKYTGSLWTNNSFGKVFDSNASADKLFKFRPGKGKVIKGWEEGVIGMKKGAKRLLAIPPELAYGDKGVPSRVPPKSTLLFEVEISRVKYAKERTENVSLSSTDTPSPPKDDANSSTSSGHSREEDDVRDRTASLNKELSSSPEKGSEKARLLARMSKMGKNVLKLPGAVAADPEEEEHESVEAGEHHVVAHEPAVVHTAPENAPERPRTHSHEHHDPAGNPHSPSRPPIAPRSVHVNRIAHSTPTQAHSPPGHVTQPHAPQHYQTEYQNGPPHHAPAPPQQQVALYQTPMLQAPPMYQQPGYAFQQPQPQYQPVFQQPPQPVYQAPPPPAPVQPSPPPASASNSGTSDAMMPLLMTESRQHQNEVRQAITKVSEKIDSLEHKVDLLKQPNDDSYGAIRPSASGLSNDSVMEASVLMNSIVRLVQENERMKKENVEKTVKVDALNERISELLHRSQKYVEQSNIFLEQRNESLQQSSSYSQSKLVELEREKTSLSTQLGTYKQNAATLEAELEILRKQDEDNREQLKKTSSKMHKHKTELLTTKESLTEKEEELQKLSSTVKNAKQERKKLAGKLSNLEEVVSDLRQEKETLEKNVAERKKKQQEVKKRMDEEMEEMKSNHEEEVNGLKERYRRELTSSSSSLSQQVAQCEADVEAKWQEKSKQMVNQSEKRWRAKYDEVVDECDALRKKISESDEKCATIKNSQSKNLREIEELQEKVKDLDDTQKKYHELRMKSIEMKQGYEKRLEDVTKEKEVAVSEVYQKSIREKEETAEKQTEPSRDKVVEQVKQIMNKVFFKIRGEFDAGDSYKGSAVMSVVLNVIKTMTLKLTSGADDEESEEEEDDDEEEEEEDEEEEEEDEEEEEEEEEEEDEEEEEEEDEENEENEEGEDKEKIEKAKQEDVHQEKEEEQIETKVERIEEDEKVEDEGSDDDKSDETQTHVDESKELEGTSEDKTDTPLHEEHTGEDSEEDESEEEDNKSEGESGGTVPASAVNKLGEPTDTENVGAVAPILQSQEAPIPQSQEDGKISSDDDSIESLHGSEEDADITSEVASDEGKNGTVDDTSEQGEQQDHLVTDLPSMDELTVDQGSPGDDIGVIVDPLGIQGPLGDNEELVSDVRIKSGELKNEAVGNISEKKVSSEADLDKTDEEEKVEEERKVESLSDLLSDSEDDVKGLFDAPVRKELPKKNKTEEEPTLKPTPPPLFDDDDDDGFDWFS